MNFKNFLKAIQYHIYVILDFIFFLIAAGFVILLRVTDFILYVIGGMMIVLVTIGFFSLFVLFSLFSKEGRKELKDLLS